MLPSRAGAGFAAGSRRRGANKDDACRRRVFRNEGDRAARRHRTPDTLSAVTDRAAALPWKAQAGSAAGKGVEALTLAALVLLVPRALGPADYGGFAVALAAATGIATATGIGGPALFARVLAPLDGERRRDVALALLARVGRTRAPLLGALAVLAAGGASVAPGDVRALHLALVAVAAVMGTAATLLSQLSLGLERTAVWSLRYPLENGVIVVGALVLHRRAGLDGAIAAIALGAGAALVLGIATAGPALRGARRGSELPPGALRFARLQAAGGTLTQAVHRGAAPACALAGASAAASAHAAIAAAAALAITYAVLQAMLVALPGAAREHARNPAAAAAVLRRTALWSACAVVPACAVVAVAAEPLLAAALGENFRDRVDALRIALVAAALAPLWALGNQLAAVREQPEAGLMGAAAGAAAFACVALLALPTAGASGAAAAMLAGVAATSATTFAALRRARE
jgi:O-antigen/teichoic acid export membrane protein